MPEISIETVKLARQLVAEHESDCASKVREVESALRRASTDSERNTAFTNVIQAHAGQVLAARAMGELTGAVGRST